MSQSPADTDAIEIVTHDDAFEPAALDLDAGRTVSLEIANKDGRVHDLVIEELDLSTGTLQPGEVVTATFEVPDSPVTYVCSLHPGMQGTLEPTTG